MRSLFGKSKPTVSKPIEIEMQEYPQHRKSSGLNTQGSIKFPFGSTKYTETNNSLSVSSIESTMPGLGSRMMNMVATEALTLNKKRVGTTLTALSAQGFYLSMGLHPSRELKEKQDQKFGRVNHFDVVKSTSQLNAFGKPMGKFTSESLMDFGIRLKFARTNPVWDGDAESVRQLSEKHWKK